VSVNITNYFEELRKDLEAAYYGIYFCELADYFTHENDDGTQMLKLLYQTLRALTQDSIGRKLVRTIYELKMLVLGGEAPQVFQCVKCGDDEDNHYFNSEAGGLVCLNCSKGILNCIRVNDSTIYTLQYIVTSTIEKLYTFTVSNEVMAELKHCVDNYKGIYIDKRMKSLELLEKLF
jgi:DNA repair protein RecO (recombination protein O)